MNELTNIELKYVMECVFESNGSADEVILCLKTQASDLNLTYKEYIMTQTAKSLLVGWK